MGHIKHKRRKSNLGLLALEPRWMFDGAAAVDAAHAAPDAAAKALIPDAPAPAQMRAADTAQNNGRKEVVFIDTSVADYKTLEAAVKPGVEIEEIDGGQSGLAQIAKWAETHSGYDSISILGHGVDGAQKIGATSLSSTVLQDPQAREQLATIGASLTPNGDLLLYGCDVAKSQSGRQFVDELAAVTGADVAASIDTTGTSGNWTLEYNSGVVGQDIAFDARDLIAYSHDLARSASMNSASQSGGNLLVRYTYNFSSATETYISVQKQFGDFAVATEFYLGNSISGVDTIDGVFSANLVTGNYLVSVKYIDSGGWAYSTNTASLAWVGNVTPAFVGGSSQSLTVAVGASAVDLKSYLHINDTDSGQTETLTQSSAPSHGVLSISGATGTSGSANITPGGAITYTPTAGYTGTDTFSIQVSDGTATATKSFTVTVNDAPTISGATAGQTVNDNATVSPFTNVTIADTGTSDGTTAQTQTVTISLGSSLQGWFSTLNGFTDLTGGNYTYSGTAAAATTAIRGLVFTPTANRVAPGSTETTAMTISVSDGVASTVTNTTTTVVSTSINDTPTNIALSAASVAENSAAGTVVGNLTSTDADTGDSYTYSLVGGATDKFQVVVGQLQVKAGANLDYETATSQGVTVRTTDAQGAFYDKAFTITVINVNEAPTNMALSAATVPENSAAGTMIGTLSATDQDVGDSFTYSIPAGSTRFQIVGSQLQVKAGANLDYESATSQTVTVRATDAGGLTYDKTFTIAVTNVNDAASVTINEGAVVVQGQSVTISNAKLASYDGEQAASTLTYTVVTKPTGGILYKGGVALNNGDTFLQSDLGAGNITYTHGGGGGASDSFVFKVTDNAANDTANTTFAITVNRQPVVANAIADQSWSGSGAKSFQFASNVFTDADADAMTYSAKQQDGSALPSWLSFSSSTRTFSGNPPAGVASIVLRVTANDGRGGSATNDFTITIANANDTATLANAIPNQTWTGSGGKSYQVPANTFSADPDGDALSYSATLQGGGALPSWLSFDTASRTFSGNPPAGVGSVNLTVTANDGNGGTVTSTFTLTLTTVNDAPVLANPLGPQTMSGPGVWSYTVPANTFSDADNDTLTWSATKADGSALPAWLSFNPATRVLSGNAPNNTPQVDVKISVSDGNGGAASSSFRLNIDQNTSNDAPVLANAIANTTWTGSGAQTYQVPGNTFTDADGDTLALSATLTGGGALPSWLHFNPQTWTFSGNPPATADGQTYAITVTANDNEGGTITGAFNLTIASANDTPFLASGTADQSMSGSGSWSYQVPVGTFTDADGDTITWSATQSDGSALPSWLSFDANTRTFSGNPPSSVSTLLLKVTGTDPSAASVSSSFTLRVTNANDAPVVANALGPQNMSGPGSWTYQVPANTFTDADNDTLTYSATQSDGSALPSWLSFDTNTRTFSGNPPWGAPSVALKVTADDGHGGSAASSFQLSIDQNTTNDAPVVANVIPAQTKDGAGAWSYQVPANTFFDADGTPVTLSASLSSGAALPSWLSFNASTWTFSGNPPASANGQTFAIKVTATDPQSSTVTNTFNLTVINANDTPTVANAIADQSWSGSGSKTFQFTANVFSDADGDAMTYTATQGDGTALPSWLTFTGATRTFSGNPPANLPYLDLKVTASDGNGGTKSTTFREYISNANDQPTASSPTISGTLGKGGSVPVPGGTFSDPDGDPLTYTAKGPNNTPLPSWLKFDPGTQTFSGTPPQGQSGSIPVTVTVTDSSGATVSTTMTLSYDNPSPPPPPPPPPPAPPPIVVEAPKPPPPAEAPTLVTSIRAAVTDNGAFTQGSQGGNAGIAAGTPVTSGGGFQVSLGAPSVNAVRDGSLFVAKGIPAVEVTTTNVISFAIPNDAFGHTNADAGVQLAAKLTDGRPLPSWVSFDPAKGTFVGEAPPDFKGTLSVTVVARDSAGHEVATTFRIQVGGGAVTDGGQAPVKPTGQDRPTPAPQGQRSGDLAPARDGKPIRTGDLHHNGKLAFTQQLKQASRHAAMARLARWV